jgi:hypothetical protein
MPRAGLAQARVWIARWRLGAAAGARFGFDRTCGFIKIKPSAMRARWGGVPLMPIFGALPPSGRVGPQPAPPGPNLAPHWRLKPLPRRLLGHVRPVPVPDRGRRSLPVPHPPDDPPDRPRVPAHQRLLDRGAHLAAMTPREYCSSPERDADPQTCRLAYFTGRCACSHPPRRRHPPQPPTHICGRQVSGSVEVWWAVGCRGDDRSAPQRTAAHRSHPPRRRHHHRSTNTQHICGRRVGGWVIGRLRGG